MEILKIWARTEHTCIPYCIILYTGTNSSIVEVLVVCTYFEMNEVNHSEVMPAKPVRKVGYTTS